MLIDFLQPLGIIGGVFGALLFIAAVVCSEKSATPGGAG